MLAIAIVLIAGFSLVTYVVLRNRRKRAGTSSDVHSCCTELCAGSSAHAHVGCDGMHRIVTISTTPEEAARITALLTQPSKEEWERFLSEGK